MIQEIAGVTKDTKIFVSSNSNSKLDLELEEDSKNVIVGGLEIDSVQVKNTDYVIPPKEYYWHIDLSDKDRKARYRPNANLRNIHAGQHKLFFAELIFLIEHYDKYKSDSQKILLYVGSAHGYHIPCLMELFPDIKFVLYDPAQFCSLLKDLANPLKDNVESFEEKNREFFHLKYFTPSLSPSPSLSLSKEKAKEKELRVEIYNQFFTDDDCQKWKDKGNVFFVSDIRNQEIKHAKNDRAEKNIDETLEENFYVGHEDADEIVLRDNTLQKGWVEKVDPIIAHLKFRCGFGREGSVKNYLDGLIYNQIWSPPSSTECRLVPIRDPKTGKFVTGKNYDNIEFERSLFYYNSVVRQQPISHEINPSIIPKTYDGVMQIIFIQIYYKFSKKNNSYVASKDEVEGFAKRLNKFVFGSDFFSKKKLI